MPTRELAVQVADNMAKFAKYAKLRVLAVYGGESINKQIHALSGSIQIVVGTPGRIIDLDGKTCLEPGFSQNRCS